MSDENENIEEGQYEEEQENGNNTNAGNESFIDDQLLKQAADAGKAVFDLTTKTGKLLFNTGRMSLKLGVKAAEKFFGNQIEGMQKNLDEIDKRKEKLKDMTDSQLSDILSNSIDNYEKAAAQSLLKERGS